MNDVKLVLCIHNHQPVGNLNGVFEHAYRAAYLPFVNVLEAHPDIKIVLHNTGPLLEWYEEHEPDYIERVRRLVERGQVELLTGGFYEPILSLIPERDAVSQIRRMTEYTEATFGTRPRGMWLAERVWEPKVARMAALAGVEYVPLDDYEFRLAGVPDEDLVGPFITEDQGHALKVFPISKKLRYVIPFAEPGETIEHMRALAERGDGLVAVLGDDGEKFGVWPGTHKHVYTDGWINRFFKALEDNSDWLRTATFAETVDASRLRGRVYLPTSSYPEMMEWALPTPARRVYESLLKRLKDEGTLDEWGPFLSGGSWKGFVAKYDETNLMVRKMYRVSRKAERLRAAMALAENEDVVSEDVGPTHGGPDLAMDPEAIGRALTALWKGQCNCAYWHGVFGGLYLPHLRSAIYEHLIRSENILESGGAKRWSWIEMTDHDLDGEQEVLLESHWANVYVAPSRGGTVFELDLRRAEWNVAGVMSRYEEAYHGLLADSEHHDEYGSGTASIHDIVRSKEKGLSRLAVSDAYARRMGVDHFLSDVGGTSLGEAFTHEIGDFVEADYGYGLVRHDCEIGVVLRRRGSVRVDGVYVAVEIEKIVRLTDDETVRFDYAITADQDVRVVFAPELSLAFLTPNEEYTSFEGEDGSRSTVARARAFEDSHGVRIADRLRNETVNVSVEPEAEIRSWPLETVSQSEGGYERVFQGVTLAPHWRLSLAAGEPARLSFALGCSQERV